MYISEKVLDEIMDKVKEAGRRYKKFQVNQFKQIKKNVTKPTLNPVKMVKRDISFAKKQVDTVTGK